MQLMKLFESLGKDHGLDYKKPFHAEKYNVGDKFVFNKDDAGFLGFVLLPSGNLVTPLHPLVAFERELKDVREKIFRNLFIEDEWIDADDIRDDILPLADGLIDDNGFSRELVWGNYLNERNIINAINDARKLASHPDKLLERYQIYDANGLKVWDFKNTRFRFQYMNDAYHNGNTLLANELSLRNVDTWLVEWKDRKFVVIVGTCVRYVELTKDSIVPDNDETAQKEFLELCPEFIKFYHQKHNDLSTAASTKIAVYGPDSKMPFILMTPEYFKQTYIESLYDHVQRELGNILQLERNEVVDNADLTEMHPDDVEELLTSNDWISLLKQHNPDVQEFCDFFDDVDTDAMYKHIDINDELSTKDLMQIFDRYLMDEHESDVEHGFFGFQAMHSWLAGGKPN